MQIYNITKERVNDLVNKAFDDPKRPKDLCLCYQCRLDVICYVLNRAKPQYVLSERGIAHLKDNYTESLQESADLARLVENGINLVAKAKRAHHLEPENSDLPESVAYFNFPTITGMILSGENFAPVECKATLYMDGEISQMKDSKWYNPYDLKKVQNGQFVFWPKSQLSNKVGEEKTFQFQLNIESDIYETSPHFFEITLISDDYVNKAFHSDNSYTCKNILLFKPD